MVVKISVHCIASAFLCESTSISSRNSTFLGLPHFDFHPPAAVTIVIGSTKTLLLCEQWVSLPILEGMCLCLSPLSQQPLNLWGILRDQIGVGAQQKKDRGRRELEIFSPTASVGAVGLAAAERGWLGSPEEQAAP